MCLRAGVQSYTERAQEGHDVEGCVDGTKNDKTYVHQTVNKPLTVEVDGSGTERAFNYCAEDQPPQHDELDEDKHHVDESSGHRNDSRLSSPPDMGDSSVLKKKHAWNLRGERNDRQDGDGAERHNYYHGSSTYFTWP